MDYRNVDMPQPENGAWTPKAPQNPDAPHEMRDSQAIREAEHMPSGNHIPIIKPVPKSMPMPMPTPMPTPMPGGKPVHKDAPADWEREVYWDKPKQPHEHMTMHMRPNANHVPEHPWEWTQGHMPEPRERFDSRDAFAHKTNPSPVVTIPADSGGCGYCITPAMSYVSMQKWGDLYEAEYGFGRGTIFAELDLPFEGKGDCRHD